MIARTWKAIATSANAPRYAQHFRDAVIPELEHIAGHAGACLMQRETGSHVELVVLTLWESMAAIGKFAGADQDRAVVAPEALAVLESFDARVQHFEIVHSTFDTRRP
ncbi:MAG TPA: hypothetical protein VKB34_05495 [Povalibacter sp.]|nr:hypothetical protein [Povalibacter sp.]